MDYSALYIVRHGATAANESRPKIMQGKGMDHPLSAIGRRQASAVAGLVAPLCIQYVISSPMARARETAHIIAEPNAVPVEIDPRLHEVDVGLWEGRSWEWVKQENGEAYKRFMSSPDTVGYPGGESYNDVLTRIRPAIQDHIKKNAGAILIVGHSVVNRVYLANVLGLSLRDARRIPQQNCCINVIDCFRTPEGIDMKLRTVNSVFHLEKPAFEGRISTHIRN